MDTEIREQIILETIESNNQKIIENAGNDSKIRAIIVENDGLKSVLEKLRNEQSAAQQVRLDVAVAEANFFMDNLVVEGFTMRELSAGEDHYQMLRIAVQNKIISLSEENSKLIIEMQAEDAEKQRQLRIELSQAKLDTEDAMSKRNAAVNALEEAKTEITRLEGHVDDLRKEIAVGARNAYKVIDSEEQGKQLKELAEKIKASRVHVYDVVPDSDINPKNYTAKRTDNGEEVTYNWTQAKNYIEITDPNEVEQFRNQHAVEEAVQDIPLDESVQDSVTPPTASEATFPTIPSAIAPEIPTVPVAVVEGNASTDGQTIEERFEALERRVTELEKVCSVNEEAA